MKKPVLFFAVILNILSVQAQITVTNADMPQPGTADIVAYDTLTNVNIGVASATAQAWNFSNLLTNYNKLAIYSPTAPYQQNAADFLGSNIYTWGPAILFSGFYGGMPLDANSWGYMYWKTDTAGFHIVGFRGYCGINYGYMNVLEGPQELLMGTPAAYGSQFPDSARWVLKYNKNPMDIDTSYTSVRKKTLTCDAFGSMTTPFGTYDVLRVHEYVTELDTISASLGSITYYSFLLRSDTLNNYMFWANGLNYPLVTVHADKNNNVKDVEFLVDTVPCYSITGNVFKTNGITKVQSGAASLILKDSWNHLFGVLETVDIDNNGNYQFANVAGGNFLVLADPDPVQYPYLLPTYFGDTAYWENATPLWMTKDTNLTINCRNDSALAVLTGPGSISGTVWADTTTQSGSVVARGVKVTLEQNPGGACGIAHSDTNGEFLFDNLPIGSYKIKVDIAGLIMDSTYYITLSSSSLDYQNRDFIYDTTSIDIYYNSSINDHNLNSQYQVNVYPNPFADNAAIHVSNPNNENRLLTFRVYDLVGRVVKEISAENTENISFTSVGMTKGLYIYELHVNRELISSGKIVVN